MQLNFDTSDLKNTLESIVQEAMRKAELGLDEVGVHLKSKLMERYASGNKAELSDATKKRRASAGISGDIPLYATGQLAGSIIREVVTGGKESYVDIRIAPGQVYAPLKGYGSPRSLQELAEGFESGRYGDKKWEGAVWEHVFNREQNQILEITTKYL